MPVAPVVPNTTVPGPVTNGWMAVQSSLEPDSDDIYLVRPGEDPRRLEVAGSDTTDEACPTWSPDGTRLMFGRLTGSNDNFSDPELVIVPVGPDGAAGTPTVIALDGFGALPGFSPFPCGVWAPDGRWVALQGPGDVWVVDTQTGEIRHLPDLRPTDLEWRPGTDQLAIAGDMGMAAPLMVVHADQHLLRVDRRAPPTRVHPGQSTHVVTGRNDDCLRTCVQSWVRRNEHDSTSLWLVDADGANDRLLVADPFNANHGVGPVWSPTGERIAYQRVAAGAANSTRSSS